MVPEVSANGDRPSPERPDHDTVLAALREPRRNVHLLGGFGPFVVGIILFVLMMLLAPTVAPERVVERPVGATSTTQVGAP